MSLGAINIQCVLHHPASGTGLLWVCFETFGVPEGPLYPPSNNPSNTIKTQPQLQPQLLPLLYSQQIVFNVLISLSVTCLRSLEIWVAWSHMDSV